MHTVVALIDRTVDLDTGRIDIGGELRAMELKVLRYLVDHANTLVTHQELLERVWGYSPQAQTRTVYSTWHRLRSALERDPARPHHFVTVAGVGVRFVSTDAPPPTNLVPTRDLLVGRTGELDRLAGADARLVTLVGPGGSGKTRLAREHGWRIRSAMPGGVWFCDLTHARTALGAAETIAEALGVRLEGAVEELETALARRGRVLVVLDNAESVLDTPEGAALGQVLGRWLDACPEARFLATSRRPVGIAGELRIGVGALGLPSADDRLDGEAIALLVHRIRLLDPSFDPAVAPNALVALVRALDGLPLAIEIAAAHAASLGPEGALLALAEHGTLQSRRLDGPERHQSLEAVVAWSWERLPPSSRTALHQLTAFAGGFSLRGALAVLSLPAGSPPAAEVVTDLVERGLVSPSPQDRRRFVLFAIVRSFVGSAPADAVARHAVYYAGLAAAVIDAEGGFMPESDPHGGAERDEALLAAWYVLGGSAVASPGRLVEYAVRVALRHGRRSDAYALARRAIREPDVEMQLRLDIILPHALRDEPRDVIAARWESLPEACVCAGFPQLAAQVELLTFGRLFSRGRFEEGRAALRRAEQLIAEVPAPSERLRAYLGAGLASRQAILTSDPDEQAALHERAAEGFLSVGRPMEAAVIRINQAQGSPVEERPAETEQVLLAAFEQVPPTWTLERVVGLVAISRMRRHQGRYGDALGAAEAAVATTIERPMTSDVQPYALIERALVRAALGDRLAAEADASRALTLARDRGLSGSEASATQVMAALARRRGDPRAETLLVDAVEQALRNREWEAAMNAAIELIDVRVGRGAAEAALAVADQVLAQGAVLGSVGSWIAMLRAELHRNAGDPRSALADLRSAEAMGGARSAPLARLARAALCAELGLEDDSADPSNASGPWAELHRARLAAARGDAEAARTALGQVRAEPGQVLLERAVAALRMTVGA